MKLNTERLIIRPFNYSDEDALYEMCSDYDTAISAGWKPHTNIRVSRNMVAHYIYSGETLAIVDRVSHRFLGTISLYDNEARTGGRHRELGFCLNKRYRGYGFMSEAVIAIIKYAFDYLSVDILTTCHEVSNIKSQKVINNCGFNYEGCFKYYRKLFDGTVCDCMYYSITKQEYKENLR